MNFTRSFAALAVTSSLVLAGCGDGDQDDDASKAGAPGSAALDVEPGDTVDVDDFVDQVKAGVEEMTTAHMSREMTGGPVATLSVEAAGDVDYSTTPPSMAMTMTTSGVDMEIRFVGGTWYMNLGEMGGGKFYTATPEDFGFGPGGDMVEMMDPTVAFESVEAGLKKVVFVGEEEVDGAEAFHYEVSVDTTEVDMYDRVPDMPETITYDYWLDGEGRMVKTESLVMGMTTTMTLSDFGTDVDIEKPAADEIAGDFSELTGSGL